MDLKGDAVDKVKSRGAGEGGGEGVKSERV